MSAIVSNAEIVHYEVLGRGRPVIFLHGWAGSWRYWVPTMQAVSYNYRAYALDLWGFGDSARVPGSYSLAAQTELLETFIAQLGIMGKVALVGHGLGALVAVQFALRSPNKLARLMLLNCPLNGIYHNRLLAETPVGLVEWLSTVPEEKADLRLEAQKTDPGALIPPLLDFQALSLKEQFPQLAMPTLLVYGLSDPLVPPPAEPLPLEYPASMGSIVFEKSGHFPMADEDAQFTRLLKEFLEMEPGASPRELQLKDQWIRRVR